MPPSKSRQLEKDIVKEIRRFLDLKGVFVFKVNNYAMPRANGRMVFHGDHGIPDICGMTKSGRFLGIEVKTKIGRQSEHQKLFEKRCLANGGIYILARSVDDLIVRSEIFSNEVNDATGANTGSTLTETF